MKRKAAPLDYYYRSFIYNSAPDKFKHYLRHRYLLNLNFNDILKIVKTAILESKFSFALNIIQKEKIQILLPREIEPGRYMSFFQFFLQNSRRDMNKASDCVNCVPKEFQEILGLALQENQFLANAVLNCEENKIFKEVAIDIQTRGISLFSSAGSVQGSCKI